MSAESEKGFKIGVIRRRSKKIEANPETGAAETIIEWTQDRFVFLDIFSSSFWKEVMFDSSMLFYGYWSAIMSLFILYNAFFLLGRQSYVNLFTAHTLMWFVTDYVGDLFYLIDMLVSSRIGYIEDGLFIMDPPKLLRNYKKSIYFRLDLLSIFPTDLLYFVFGFGSSMVRVNRLLRVNSILHLFTMLETRTSFPNLMRIIKLLVCVILILHWNACIYFLISRALGLGSDDWVYPNDMVEFNLLPDDHIYHKTLHEYVVTLWWSVLTLTTIADTEHPETTSAFMYVIACSLIGVLLLASVSGKYGAMINNAYMARDEFRQQMDDVKHYMQSRMVGKELQTRVINWFNYTWQTCGTLDETRALYCLPYNLQSEIAMQVHLDTLKSVRLFQDCEPGLLNDLVLKLQPQVFSPGDFVCRKGDVGREMYIVKLGKIEVVSEDLTRVFKVFGKGESFGDLSMLTIPGNKYGNKRSANVRSVGFTELFSLSKNDLLRALESYPEAKSMLIEKASEILRKDGAIDEELAKSVAMESSEAKIAASLEILNTLVSEVEKNQQDHEAMEERLNKSMNDVLEMLEDIKNKI